MLVLLGGSKLPCSSSAIVSSSVNEAQNQRSIFERKIYVVKKIFPSKPIFVEGGDDDSLLGS
jgi:hypothetical protein